MMRSTLTRTAGAIGILLVLTPEPGTAQNRGRSGEPWRTPAFTIEAYTGFSTFSRFMEEHVLTGNSLFPVGQRSVKADVAYVLGGALGAWIWEGTAVRIGYTWATTEFDYEDTSGLDRDLLDRDGLNNLNAHIIGLEVIQLVLDPKRRITPYLVAGINGEFWILGDRERNDAILATDASQFRWGGTAGIGVQIRASRPLAFRLEASRYILGNPFRGNSAFRPQSGFIFDKPDSVTMPRYTLGLIYTFVRGR